jgi:hypothetical protein
LSDDFSQVVDLQGIFLLKRTNLHGKSDNPKQHFAASPLRTALHGVTV